MLKKKILRVELLKLFILDEADEILARGYLDQIKEIFNFCHKIYKSAYSLLLSHQKFLILQNVT